MGQDCWNTDRTNQRGTSDLRGGPTRVWPRGSYDPDGPFLTHEYLNLCVKFDSRAADRFTGVWQAPISRKTRAAWLAKFGLDMDLGDQG